MKKVLFSLFILVFISCSSDRESVEEALIVKQWVVTTVDACPYDQSSSDYISHCVSESTYKTVTSKWVSTAPEMNCDKITFKDLNGVEVNRIVSGTSSGYNTCTTD